MTELLNQRLSVSLAEAEDLWQHSVNPPGEFGATREDIGISPDGRWAIRCLQALWRLGKEPRVNAVERVAEVMEGEIRRLNKFGIDTLSCAFIPSPEENEFYIVCPFISDIRSCPIKDYATIVAPKLMQYYHDAASRIQNRGIAYFLKDIEYRRQYSMSMAVGAHRPFLHDLDPEISSSIEQVEARMDTLHVYVGIN